MSARREGWLTISVDDGHPHDLRVAELLVQRNLKATFYIPAQNPERPVMAPAQIKELAKYFDVGAHTLHHLPLVTMRREEAWTEINGSKLWLENLLGHSVSAFCFPRGKFNTETVQMVRRAGFLGARSCMYNLLQPPRNRFIWGISTHAYNHTPLIQIRHALLEGNFRGLWSYFSILRGARDWGEHFLRSMKWVEQHGGVAHLYLHGWEIDACSAWPSLVGILDHIQHRSGLTNVTNSDLYMRFGAKDSALSVSSSNCI